MAKSSAVVYIDPFSKEVLKFSKNNFENVSSYKNFFIGSRVSFEDLITHTFKISKNIPKEDMDVTVELKMYEDAGLSTDKKYKINYIKKELDYEESYIIEAYAVETEKIEKELSFVFDKAKYIDFLAAPNLAFSTLYNNKILAPKKDIFVYFDENEAFFSVYKEGVYLSSSSLPTLNEILKKVNEDGYGYESEDLIKVLSYKGLDSSKYNEDEIPLYQKISTIFSDIFLKINNIAMHNRSIFGFDQIERIFVTTRYGRVKGLREFIHSIGLVDTEVRDFNLFKQKISKNFLEKVVGFYILDKFLQKDSSDNLSFIERKPSWYRTTAGRFILFVFLVCILFGSYPAYLQSEITSMQKEKSALENQYNNLKRKTFHIKREIATVKQRIKEVKKEFNAQSDKISNIAKSINELADIKSKDKKDTKTILIINGYLKKYKLAVKNFEFKNDGEINIEIVAKYSERDKIAKFMKELIGSGFIEVSTDEIKLDNSYYISKIEMVR